MAVPVAEMVEFKLSVLSLQSGPLLVTVGAAGGFGSTRLMGPTLLDGQLESVTKMSL